jgi:hypothetical protein
MLIKKQILARDTLLLHAVCVHALFVLLRVFGVPVILVALFAPTLVQVLRIQLPLGKLFEQLNLF